MRALIWHTWDFIYLFWYIIFVSLANTPPHQHSYLHTDWTKMLCMSNDSISAVYCVAHSDTELTLSLCGALVTSRVYTGVKWCMRLLRLSLVMKDCEWKSGAMCQAPESAKDWTDEQAVDKMVNEKCNLGCPLAHATPLTYVIAFSLNLLHLGVGTYVKHRYFRWGVCK